MSDLDPRDFRAALGRFASGVTVVSTLDDGRPFGMTVSAFSSVSLEPPLVLVCIAHKAANHDRIARVGRYGVTLLAADQQVLSNHFAGRPDTSLDVRWEVDGWGAPRLLGGLAFLDCAVHEAVRAGDHTIYVGRVEGVAVADGAPLVYWRGGYRALADAT